MTSKDRPASVDEAPSFYKPGNYGPGQSYGYLMHRAVKSILTQADLQLAVLDLTHAQWLPLYFLYKRGEGCGVAEMAREQGIDCAGMTRSLDRLEAKGLVRRERSSTDRRVVNVVLTDAGREAADQVPGVLSGVLNAHLKGFTQAEWQQLLGLLQRVLDNGEALRGSGA